MAEFRSIKMFLFLMLVPHFTAAAAAGELSLIVRNGDDATLPCGNVLDDHNNCDSTTWLFVEARSPVAVSLITDGKVDKTAAAKSDRLNVTEDCSLVIKTVTDQDVGRYDCRQYRSGQQGEDASVHLSVVNMFEHNDTGEVTLHCGVLTHEQCPQSVKWLHQGQTVDEDNRGMRTSNSPCYASVTFQVSHFSYTSRFKLFTCEVTDWKNKKGVFSFRSQPSGEDTTAESTTTATTPTTTTKPSQNHTTAGCSALNFIMLMMRVAELLLLTVITVLLIRARGNQTPPDDNAVNSDADDGVVNYENVSENEPSVSVRLH